MVHLTLAMPGITTTFHLPGTMQQQPIDQHPQLVIDEAETNGLQPLTIWANKPAITRTYCRRRIRPKKDRTEEPQSAQGVFTHNPSPSPQLHSKREPDALESEVMHGHSTRKRLENAGYRAQPTNIEPPQTRSRVKALAGRGLMGKQHNKRRHNNF